MVVVNNDVCQTWHALESQVNKGKVKKIGMSNFAPQLLRQIMATATIQPSIFQTELHCQNTQENMIRLARESGMRVEAYSAFGASSYKALPFHLRAKDGESNPNAYLVTNSVVEGVAKKHRKTPHQTLLRWALQRGTCPISKTTSANRMLENRDVFSFELDHEDMAILSSLNQNLKYNDPAKYTEQLFGTFCPIFME